METAFSSPIGLWAERIFLDAGLIRQIERVVMEHLAGHIVGVPGMSLLGSSSLCFWGSQQRIYSTASKLFWLGFAELVETVGLSMSPLSSNLIRVVALKKTRRDC